MRRFLRNGSGGSVLIFVIGILGLMAALATSLMSVSALDRKLGQYAADAAMTRLAAESGVEDTLAFIRDRLSGGPIDEEIWRLMTDGREVPMRSGAAESGRCVARVTIADESGKLNLNDGNEPWAGANEGRLETILRFYVNRVCPGRGDAVANALFQDARCRRSMYANDQFPSMVAVEKALWTTDLTPAERERVLDGLTIHSWRDPDVLKPGTRVYGPAGNDPREAMSPSGADLLDMVGIPIDRWMQFQTREFRLEPRSPVNLNTAPVELLAALIEPIQGAFLEEGPAECQSCEHYGWWATGRSASSIVPYDMSTPEADTKVYTMGTIRLTQAFTAGQADELARLMHERIHGGADREPNPFETWEEFKEFLNREIEGSADLAGGTAARRLFVGDGFAMGDDRLKAYRPQPWVNPHASVTDRPIAGFSNTWRTKYAAKPVNVSSSITSASADAAVRQWYDAYYAQFLKDAVFANFNPNSLLNDWNPNANIHLGVDKAQLTRYSTDGCLEPMGVFAIKSRGELHVENGGVVSATTLQCVVTVFLPLRLTTQAQFLDGFSLQPGEQDLSRYFDPLEEHEPGPITWMSDMFGNMHAGPNGYGLSLQSYPEPVFAHPDVEARIRESRYDGYLMVANNETRTGQSLSSFALRSGISALAEFNGILDDPLRLHFAGAFVNGNAALFTPGMATEYHARGDNHFHSGRLTGVSDGVTPGALFPDGAYSERLRTLAYRFGNCNADAARDFGGRVGGVSFWIKPNFHAGISTRIRKLFSGPSKAGIYGNQTWTALLYLSNPSSLETDGISDMRFRSVPWPTGFTIKGWINGGSSSWSLDGGHYGITQRNCWMPTRCLAFGTAWMDDPVQGSGYSKFLMSDNCTGTVARNFPLSGQLLRSAKPASPFDAHRWLAVAVNWNLDAAGIDGPRDPSDRSPKKKSMISLFGAAQDGAPGGRMENCNPYLVSGSQNTTHRFTTSFNLEWMRFGELPSSSGPDFSAPQASPYAADCTIDDVKITTSTAVDAWHANMGRYHWRLQPFTDSGGRNFLGRYISPEIALHSRLEALEGVLRLRSVAWTLYRPRHSQARSGNVPMSENLYRSISVNSEDREDPCSIYWAEHDSSVTDDVRRAWDPVSVDLWKAEGGWYFHDRGEMLKRPTYPGGSSAPRADELRYEPGQPFRLSAWLHMPNRASLNDPAMLESPVLDDITCMFELSRARVLEWRIAR